jgi:hypothetical protein
MMTEIPMSMQNQQAIDPRSNAAIKRKFEFLAGLYPSGRDIDDIINQVASEKNLSHEDAEKISKGTLDAYVEEKIVSKINRNDNGQKIMLTKEGRISLFSYLKMLRENDKEKYFTYLRKWASIDDKAAESLYKKELIIAIADKWQISCMLAAPMIENDIIVNYAKFVGKPSDAKIAGEVLAAIGGLTLLGLAISKKMNASDGTSKSAHSLTKEGRRALGTLFDQIKAQDKGQKIVQKTERMPAPKKIMYLLLSVFSLAFVISTGFFSGVGEETFGYMLICGIMPVVILILIDFMIPLFAKLFKK